MVFLFTSPTTGYILISIPCFGSTGLHKKYVRDFQSSQSHRFVSAALLCSRSFPAVCGGDVRTVAAGVGCGGCLHRPPTLSVSRFPAVPQLWSVVHVCTHWHFLLPNVRPSFPPHWPNHPDSLPLILTSSRLEEV